jgi:hypothetical protein
MCALIIIKNKNFKYLLNILFRLAQNFNCSDILIHSNKKLIKIKLINKLDLPATLLALDDIDGWSLRGSMIGIAF